MKKRFLIYIMLFAALFLSSCEITPSRLVKAWGGEWSGSCHITDASGAWIDNNDTHLPCTVTFTVADDCTATCSVSIKGFAPMFNFNVDQITDRDIVLSGSCQPSPDVRYLSAIPDLTVRRSGKRVMNIKGTYNDPTDDCGFCFELELSRVTE